MHSLNWLMYGIPLDRQYYFMYDLESIKWNSLRISLSERLRHESLRPHGLYSPWNSPGQNIGVGSLSLLQGIFPTQGSNPGLPHCKQIIYQLTHKESPRTLKWVAYPFSRGSSWPRNWTGVSCIAGRFFTNWTIREAYTIYIRVYISSKMSGNSSNADIMNVWNFIKFLIIKILKNFKHTLLFCL